MALWAKTQELPSGIFQQVCTLYAPDLFPIEVRHYLAQWLEEQNWNEIDEEDVAFSQDAQALVEQLIGKLNEVGSNLDFVQQIQFQNYADGFERFLSRPLDLVRIVKHCLNREIQLIQQAEMENQDAQAFVEQLIGKLNEVGPTSRKIFFSAGCRVWNLILSLLALSAMRSFCYLSCYNE